jgi:hypothetical protein
MQSRLRSVGVSCSVISEVSNNGGKYGRRRSTLNNGCKPRKGGVLSSKALLVSNLKLVWYPVLIMALLVLSIGFLQNLMDLLVDVLNLLNESGGFVGLRLNMGRVCLCGCKR